MLAVSHPGKIGDALYALPTCRELAAQFGEKVDFYTSSYCEPMRELVEYQSYINRMVVPAHYVIERMDMGVQPWYMPIPEKEYTAIYQLGFKHVPDRALHQFMALDAGIDKPLPIVYDYPEIDDHRAQFYVIAPRGSSSYADLFYDVGIRLIERGFGIAVIGGPRESIFHLDEISHPAIHDLTGIDMLSTVALLSKAKGFVGLMSSQLVLANGFDFPKVAPHDGVHWDMRHVVYSNTNYYPINPTADEVLTLLGL